MANQEHVDILRQGVEVWNQWRKENPNTKPDLSNQIMRRIRLSKANLSETNLVGADLWWAQLNETNMRRVQLKDTNLKESNLARADLRWSDLTQTILTEANLAGTDLRWCSLKQTVLKDAKLYKATLGYNSFISINLSQTKGLNTLQHGGPSSIDIDTLIKSKGKIPIEFLEGIGVPKDVIENMGYFVDIPTIQFYSCFISYNSQDEEFAQQLSSRMKREGLRVWFAPDNIQGGKKIHEQVFEAIRYHDKLIIVLSEHSMNSNWVETEIRRARKRERDEGRRVLFPIRLGDYEVLRDWQLFDADEGRDLAQEIREYFIPDFSDWKNYDSFTKGFERLLADLRKDES